MAPLPPRDLIDQAAFTIEFQKRKFLNMGMDPADHFNTTVNIITPSRHVSITPDFLRRIFSLMGHILSYVLDVSPTYKCTTFLENAFTRIATMVYQGENTVFIQDKNQDGCRVILNRTDLISLQNMEWAISELLVRKTQLHYPGMVTEQFNQICNYFKSNCKGVGNIEEMKTIIKNSYRLIGLKHTVLID